MRTPPRRSRRRWRRATRSLCFGLSRGSGNGRDAGRGRQGSPEPGHDRRGREPGQAGDDQRGAAAEVEHAYEAEVTRGGRGLLLLPAAFARPRVWAMLDPPWQPAIVYPPRGLGTLWAPRCSTRAPTLLRAAGASTLA
jgi:hypothetical protein